MDTSLGNNGAPLPSLSSFPFWDMVPRTLGWPPACFVARNALELPIFLFLFLWKHRDCSVTVLPAAQFTQCWRRKPDSVCARQALCQLLRLPRRSCVPMQICPILDLDDYLLHWTFTLFSSEAEYKWCTVTPSLSSVFLHWGVFWAQHWLFDALVLLLWNGRLSHVFPRQGDAECRL